MPVDIFKSLRRLTVLHLGSNQLEELDESLLRESQQLEDVDLSRNNLFELPANLFNRIHIAP